MATTDHTARPYSSVSPLFPLGPARRAQQTFETRTAGLKLARQSLNGLLDYSTACLNVRRFVLDESTSPWPLTAAQTDGLQAALHFLDEYTELLRRERDG